ncbi:hypothetical protein NLI96_g10562 [Meripilus lineatus]|uniref:Chromo domain-containing protein n=1 Tax=Meripilus lineatus TaxID=2056292 RepID=A0AAD5YE77_9APHY|nr:hypothetical protein NLI96_g10562 [Physisporinus lineatus]
MTKANQSDWVEKLPMVEFAMNSTVSATTGFAPFEINGTMPRMISEFKEQQTVPGVDAFVNTIRDNLMMVHDAIIESRVTQTHQANRRRQPEHQQQGGHERPLLEAGGSAYLLTKNLSLPKGRAHKLLPKFLGPYKILEGSPESSNYVLELPDKLKTRGIHPRFHVSRLKPFIANDNRLFPRRDPKVFYDYGMPDDIEWLVDNIIGHQWNKNKLQFHVKWNMGDTTWEPREHCEDLKVLDDYLQLMGANSPEDLPRYVATKRTNGPPQTSGSKAPQATRNNPRKL